MKQNLEFGPASRIHLSNIDLTDVTFVGATEDASEVVLAACRMTRCDLSQLGHAVVGSCVLTDCVEPSEHGPYWNYVVIR